MISDASAHLPVMLAEALEALSIDPAGFYVDCTFGRGGHSRAILERLGPTGRLFALDKDLAAVASDEANRLSLDKRFSIEHGSFADVVIWAERLQQTGCVSGVLMDLGVSSPQLDDSDRGFSFMRDGPLDMRMDTTCGDTASQWLDTVKEAELARVLRVFGEERFSRRIAQALVAARPIRTTLELARVIERAVPTREKGKHPATRSFQAIRIALNGELDDLEKALGGMVSVLKPGGRLVVIAFHSLEDRIVKRFMRDAERGSPMPVKFPLPEKSQTTLCRIGKKQMPSAEEIIRNVRARSAVLRVAERVAA